MDAPTYGLTRELPDIPYDQAVERVTEALASEGFGVLTEIDVRETLKKKLDVEFRKYVILGACNPPLAHRALQAELLMGLLLPCNVVVMEGDGGGSVVSLIQPVEMFRIVDNPEVAPIADEVGARLERVLEKL
jgi:uncharacterized protein (DUF302 family)